MLRSLFGKVPTREEIENDVTQQIEKMARSGHNPPPPGWTMAGGLPMADRPSAPERPPAPAAQMKANFEAAIATAKADTRGADTRGAQRPESSPGSKATATRKRPTAKQAGTRRASAAGSASAKAGAPTPRPAARKRPTTKATGAKKTTTKAAPRKGS